MSSMPGTVQVVVPRRFRIIEVPPADRSDRTVVSMTKDKKDGTIKLEKKQVGPGPDERQFDVIMRNGNSMRLTLEELHKQGFTQNPEVQNIDTGELLPVIDPTAEELFRAGQTVIVGSEETR